MQMLNLRTFTLGLPLGAALSLSVACGGNDDGGKKNGNGGNGGTTSMNGGSSSGGSGNKAGSSNGGGGSGSGGSGVSLPGDKPLGTLSDSEVEQLCDDYEAFFSSGSFAASQQEFACLLSGVFLASLSGPMTDAELQMACKAGYDECKQMPLEPEPSECSKPDASCTATVAEVEKCMKDSSQAFQDLVAELPTCAELTLTSEEPEMTEPMDPPSCVVVREKCPGFETPSSDLP
jgi:hypothetical protein